MRQKWRGSGLRVEGSCGGGQRPSLQHHSTGFEEGAPGPCAWQELPQPSTRPPGGRLHSPRASLSPCAHGAATFACLPQGAALRVPRQKLRRPEWAVWVLCRGRGSGPSLMPPWLLCESPTLRPSSHLGAGIPPAGSWLQRRPHCPQSSLCPKPPASEGTAASLAGGVIGVGGPQVPCAPLQVS